MDINTHINNIIAENTFEVRSKNNPDACPCYTNKPCHDISASDLNCFLCYCPNYDTEKEIGGCKINNPKGKWYNHGLPPHEKVWDCSDCEYPHKESIVKEYLRTVFFDRKKDNESDKDKKE